MSRAFGQQVPAGRRKQGRTARTGVHVGLILPAWGKRSSCSCACEVTPLLSERGCFVEYSTCMFAFLLGPRTPHPHTFVISSGASSRCWVGARRLRTGTAVVGLVSSTSTCTHTSCRYLNVVTAPDEPYSVIAQLTEALVLYLSRCGVTKAKAILLCTQYATGLPCWENLRTLRPELIALRVPRACMGKLKHPSSN